MGARGTRGWHNGRVSYRLPRTTTVRSAGVAVLAALTLVLTGCGGSDSSDEPSASASPTPSVAVPDGVTLTEPGTKLHFGDTADVAYLPNKDRGTVISLKVTRVVKASIKDLSAYVLDKRTRNSTPYYVYVNVKNLGEGNVGGTDVPVWAVNEKNVLVHSSTFTNDFAPCPSRALPKKFGPGAKRHACLVYLLPGHGRLESVSFRPRQSVAGIEWSGKVLTPSQAEKQDQEKAKARKKHQDGKKKAKS